MGAQRSLIACRLSSYHPFEAGAFEHLAALGVGHVELSPPQPDELDDLRAALDRHGLAVSSLHAECDLTRPTVADDVAAQMPAFAALNCRIMFTSVRREQLPLEEACRRLRAAGEVAQAHGVTIALETHPDLATNADVALETMRTVNHPHVRLNFDTANIYFYNRNIDCVAELRKVAAYVAAVHLKDTDGGYRHWHFPALGQGVVDFAGVFAVLDEVGFAGPFTLEIEGLEGEVRTEQLVRQRVADSVAYLRNLGRF